MDGTSRGQLSRLVALTSVTVTMLVAVACGSGSQTQSAGPIYMGELFGMTGRTATGGERWHRGDTLAVNEINAAGGVLGHQVKQDLEDTAGDVVDAVPALRKIETSKPAFLIGPTSLEFSGLKASLDQLGVPTMAIIPAAQFDNINDPIVFRPIVGDTAEAKALAWYAFHINCTKAALFLENNDSGQGYVQPLTDAMSSHGGSIVANDALVSNQVSYRSEILQAFAKGPQCAFIQINQQSTSTFFANLRQLGDLTIPFIGTSNYNDITNWKGAGLPPGNTQLTGDTGAAPSGPATDHFSQIYGSAYGSESLDPKPTYFAQFTYDGTIVFALAMTMANSTDPKVWLKDVTRVTTNESAAECSTYADCVALLKQGKQIDYEGASGNMDFDQHHNVYSAFNIVTFDSQGALQVVATVPADQAAQY